MFEKLLCCWVALEQRWINSPEHEEGMATAEYAIGVLATVHVPKRTWLGVSPAAREPWYCNESTSWEVPAEPSGVL